MRVLAELFENNREWARKMTEHDPHFFERLAAQQSPKYLWIGCSDSRVPANEIIGLMPGEVFVHRNVGNVVVHTDLNCLSVIQYAVEVLGVNHIIVTGHYGCGGVAAAMNGREFGLLDNWLRHLKDIYEKNENELSQIELFDDRFARFCELNVRQQVYNICHTTIVQQAWRSGQALSVHGWIYGLKDGLIKDLDVTVTNVDEVNALYRMGGGTPPAP